MMNNMMLSPDTALSAMQAGQVNSDKPSSLQAQAKAAAKDAELSRVAKDFEAVFLTEMLKPMFEGLEVDGMFGGGKGEEVFRGMILDEYGKILADKGGIGLADNIKAELLKLQEAQGKGEPK